MSQSKLFMAIFFTALIVTVVAIKVLSSSYIDYNHILDGQAAFFLYVVVSNNDGKTIVIQNKLNHVKEYAECLQMRS